MNELRAKGFDACRSAGSHSPWDVWAYNPKTGQVILIQVKTKKGKRKLVIKDKTQFTSAQVDTATYSWEK